MNQRSPTSPKVVFVSTSMSSEIFSENDGQ